MGFCGKALECPCPAQALMLGPDLVVQAFVSRNSTSALALMPLAACCGDSVVCAPGRRQVVPGAALRARAV